MFDWDLDIIRKIFKRNTAMLPQMTRMNIKRLYYMALIAAPFNLVHILFFYFKVPGSDSEALWRLGIMFSHLGLLVLMVIVAFIARRLLQSEMASLTRLYIFQFATILITLIFGIVIVAVDQLVTPNITPFFVIVIVISLIYLIRPIIYIPLLLLTSIFFFISIGFTQSDPAILLSNRVNGFTITGIGMLISIILWESNITNLTQKAYIERQQQKLEESNERLSYYATHDSMTGLINRREFLHVVDHELLRMKRYNFAATIILTDIDSFKAINDQFGHPIGDEVLVAFARCLKDEVREIDSVARWGGEEFIIFLPETPLAAGLEVAERIRHRIESESFLTDDGVVKITASFGVSELTGVSDASFIKCYERADRLLYIAKQSGRNIVKG